MLSNWARQYRAVQKRSLGYQPWDSLNFYLVPSPPRCIVNAQRPHNVLHGLLCLRMHHWILAADRIAVQVTPIPGPAKFVGSSIATLSPLLFAQGSDFVCSILARAALVFFG
ncbi:hypothetical protein M409DRAFT_25132 [Zasmidium cellare ATCC 36951]|uniref:Uncharacterized protein n=1 Tax=Zasmidium cellare ATCC 36951 TaxID=1080233 RepID=A0A6A6CGD9_ZASCE|nr:uncharacterized protein M409DRAFT_25132 [Zasmidium cellare ATCC 36951]KAF2164739.1 hypothetical protein M409DRAFT_25132 [Zasmidium cellare ATCC 36951]